MMIDSADDIKLSKIPRPQKGSYAFSSNRFGFVSTTGIKQLFHWFSATLFRIFADLVIVISLSIVSILFSVRAAAMRHILEDGNNSCFSRE